MWARKNYEEAAEQIAGMFVSSDGKDTINQLSTKVATLHNLNPEGIRTLVRLANVSAFDKTFTKRAESKSEDRMIEFELGDPEVVINNLYASAKSAAPVEKTAYDRSSDLYGDMPKAPLEKQAAAPVQKKEEGVEYSPEMMKYAFVQAKERIEMTQKQAVCRWADTMDKAAQLARTVIRSSDKQLLFEKDAVAILGEGIVPELTAVRSRVISGNSPLCGGEKVAEVIRKHVAVSPKEHRPIIEMLKEARAARETVENSKRGVAWLEANMKRLG